MIKHLLVFFFVAIFLGGLWLLLTSVDYFGTALRSAESVEAQTAQYEQEIFSVLERMKLISLDSAVFQTREFQSLVDISIPLPPPSLARPNPFAKVE